MSLASGPATVAVGDAARIAPRFLAAPPDLSARCPALAAVLAARWDQASPEPDRGSPRVARSCLIAGLTVGTGAVGLRLAIAFAQAGRSTTLIDVTPPGASAPRLIECPGSGSLQRANGDDGLSPRFLTDEPNLAVILAGTPDLPGGDLHLEDRIAALLTRHRAEPDGVAIIATPALAVAPSALAVARYAGGVLLCVTPGRTTRSDAIRARDALQEAGGRVWGVILGNEDEAR